MSHWPSHLWVVRHGQSAGNVARDEADAAGALRIALSHRDVDVPLSPLGERQAAALGHWFSKKDVRPHVILASPYVRARQTAEIFRKAGGAIEGTCICLDERLREKEFGVLDGLTHAGIERFYPEQSEFRTLLGKFYHRPPGGESWADVILRLRSLVNTAALQYEGKPVMIVAHQAVVLCMRYILEGLSEEEILSIDRDADVGNCAITEYKFAPNEGAGGALELKAYNLTAPMRDEQTEVTTERDRMVAARG